MGENKPTMTSGESNVDYNIKFGTLRQNRESPHRLRGAQPAPGAAANGRNATFPICSECDAPMPERSHSRPEAASPDTARILPLAGRRTEGYSRS
jgi:hypothetical protein